MMGSGRSSILRWAAPAAVRRRRSRRQRPMPPQQPALGHRRVRRLPRPGPRTLLAVLAVILLLGGVWLWLRDSSLVAVRKVRVTGASGPDAAQIRSALIAAAHNMTTLDVNMKQLRTAVAPYPVVKRLDVTTQFPHGMRIRVIEQDAGGVRRRRRAADGGGRRRHPAARCGRQRRRCRRSRCRWCLAARTSPGTRRARSSCSSAAPYALLSKVETVTDGQAHGLVAQLRNGPSLYFGDTDAAGGQVDGGGRGAGRLAVGRSRLHRRHRSEPAGRRRRGRCQRLDHEFGDRRRRPPTRAAPRARRVRRAARRRRARRRREDEAEPQVEGYGSPKGQLSVPNRDLAVLQRSLRTHRSR